MTLFPNNTTKQVVDKELNKKLKKFDERIENNSSEITSLKSRVSNTEDNITSINGDIEDIEEDIGSLDTRVDTVELALDEKQDTLNFDNSPIENSDNPVKSGGIYDALETKLDKESVKFDPEPNGTDALSTGGAYDIVQDLTSQLNDYKRNGVFLTTDADGEKVNDGTIVINNNQTVENTKAIEVRKGDTSLKDTSVNGDLSVSGDETVNGSVTVLNDINSNNVNASGDMTVNNIIASGDINGALKKSITVTDKDNATHTYNNTDDVEITSVLSAQKDINGDSIDQTYIKNNKLGVANGVATLDNSGRLPYSQLPESAMELKGLWNADTNTPTLVQGVGTNGDFYIVSVGGTQFGEGFNVNDRIIFVSEDNLWHRLPYTVTANVTSVNGYQGAVNLRGTDIQKSSSESENISNCLDALQNITNGTFKTALLNFCYPVGSLYWSSNSANPSTLFGGTWVQIKDRFVWAKGDSDTVNATGGAKTVTLEVANLPSHTHTFIPSGSISITTNPTFTGSAVTSGANNRGHTHGFAHSHGYTPSGSIGSSAGATDNVTGGGGKHTHTTASQSTSTTGGGGEHSHYVGLYNNNAGTTWYGGTSSIKPLALDGSFGDSANTLNISDNISSTSGFSSRRRVGVSGWNFDWSSSGYDLRTGIISNHTHSYSHTHTTNEVANHAHSAYFTGTAGTTTSQSTSTSDGESQNHTHSVTASGTISGGAYKFTGTSGTTGNTGSGTAVDKMPPYIVKYCWERTA